MTYPKTPGLADIPHGYGPNTAEIQQMIERSDALTPDQCDKMFAYIYTDRDPAYRALYMPRDYAWQAFHEGLTFHDLRIEFDTLWHDLLTKAPAPRNRHNLVVSDPVCATLLARHVDSGGPFTRADLNTLQAPWRFVVDGDERSRLALAMFVHWPHPGGELWAIVDSVLAGAT